MTVEILERAVASTAEVLANVKPDQLDEPTPCASWKIRDLINHFVGGTFFFAATVSGRPLPQPEGGAPDFTEGDMVSTYRTGAADEAAAFRSPGAMDKVIKMPFGDVPGSVLVLIAATDQFVHGWDLARATGQATADLDPELAEQLLAFARNAIPDELRGEDTKAPFGPAVEVPESAPPADRLAAFQGRQV